MQHKLLSLCIDTSAGSNRLAECLDSVVIVPTANLLDVLLLVSEQNETALSIAGDYSRRYPDLIRIECADGQKTFIEQSAELALGKYIRPIGSDCIVEPSDMDAMLRFLSDCDDDIVIHGCTIVDDSTGVKEGYSAPLGLVGRGMSVEAAAPMMCDAPSQSAVVKTEIVRRSDSVDCWRNDYSAFFINGLMQAVTVGGVDADLCHFTAPVSLVQSDAEQLEQVIFNLIDLLGAYASLADSKAPSVNCIAHRIAHLSVARLGLLLSLECDSRVQDRIYAFFGKLRRANKRVYDRFIADKYAKKLRWGKFMYRPVVKLYQKRIVK